MTQIITGATTLNIARDWLRARVDEGERCPLCQQLAKVYRRRIHHTIAKNLIEIHRIEAATGDPWVHVPSQIKAAREFSIARYWGVTEELAIPRADGGRAGWWRLTSLGTAFVRKARKVQTYALLYDGRCLGFDGDSIDITEALGSKFNYTDLMDGV